MVYIPVVPILKTSFTCNSNVFIFLFFFCVCFRRILPLTCTRLSKKTYILGKQVSTSQLWNKPLLKTKKNKEGGTTRWWGLILLQVPNSSLTARCYFLCAGKCEDVIPLIHPPVETGNSRVWYSSLSYQEHIVSRSYHSPTGWTSESPSTVFIAGMCLAVPLCCDVTCRCNSSSLYRQFLWKPLLEPW